MSNINVKKIISFLAHIIKYSLANDYTCFDGYYCTSFYGNSIRGNNDSIAKACSLDSNCKAFRYSWKKGYGFKCKKFEPKSTMVNEIVRLIAGEYEQDEWSICRFGSGKKDNRIQ